MRFLLMGHAVRVHIAIGKEDAIFMVAADAGGVGGHGKVDDSGGGWAIRNEIAGKYEVISASFVLDFCQKIDHCECNSLA